MKKNKKYLEIAVISFLAIAVVMALIIGLFYLIGGDIEPSEILSLYIGSILIFYIPLMIIVFFATFSFKLGRKVTELEAVNFNFFEDKDYYRDILKNYSILELSYINNMTTLKEKDVMASLLGLEMKNILKIENNKIMITDKKTFISYPEEYIVNNCLTEKAIIDGVQLTNIVKSTVLEKGLIQKETNIIKEILWMFIKTTIATIMSIIFFMLNIEIPSYTSEIIAVLFSLVTMILILFSLFSWVYLLSYIYHKLKSYELTEDGKEIRKKLQGLKKYIEDFGNLQDNEKESLVLWEDYLIYSVMFGTNNLILKKMKDMIEIKSHGKLSKTAIFIIVFIIVLYLFFQ